MIIEALSNIGFGIAELFFKMLPDFEWSVTSASWSAAKSILDGICYFLPLDTVTSIISLIVSLALLRVTLKFISMALGLIPFIKFG